MFTYQTFTRINEAKVRGMFFPSGQVHSWMSRNVMRPAKTIADATTPSRTGTMAALNYADMGSNQSGCWFNMGNAASYALFVHEGTTGPIYGDSGYLLLGKQSPTGPEYPNMMRAESVSGQKPQPWLAEAAATALQAKGFPATTGKIRAGA